MLQEARSTSSPSTKPIASRNGATTSAPNTCACARRRRSARRRADDRGDGDRRRADARRHRRAAVRCAARACSCARSTGRTCFWPCGPRAMRRACSPSGSTRTRARAASSIAPRADAPRSWRANFPTSGRRALPYHAGLDHVVRVAQPGRLPAGGRRRHVRDDRLRHGRSTSPTCASSSTPTCRPRSRPITRRSAAPAATVCRPTAFTLYGAGDIELRRRQIAEGGAPDERKRDRNGEARRSRDAVRDGALPPPDAARHVRRGIRPLRPLRRLPGRGAG